MKRLLSSKPAVLLSVALMSALAAAPASANWFSADPSTGMRRHIGSAPNPKPEDIRADRAARSAEAAKPNLNADSTITAPIVEGG